MDRIRNFAIIAHIDHGKSTLADRLLEFTKTISTHHEEQMLDRNPISRERGITIKLAPVRMQYQAQNVQSFILNLIDTPGHVDFSYEVDRTLACVEGAILLVDATQGIQAQTISNAYKAIEKGLEIIPVINKIDMPNAEIEKTKEAFIDFLGCEEQDIFLISAKTGQGVEKVLEAIVKYIPPPTGNKNVQTGLNHHDVQTGLKPVSTCDNHSLKPVSTEIACPFQALIFDSYYDTHKGVIAFVRVFSGSCKKNDTLFLHASDQTFQTTEVGIFSPDLIPSQQLFAGEIGYIVTNLKDIHQVRVGDTISHSHTAPPLTGYKHAQPVVFASMFPTETHEYENVTKALEKIQLNDASLTFQPIYSQALGPGYRVGFLGLLHADVIRERLEREYNLDLVLTPPQVDYKIEHNSYYEPIVKLLLITPQTYVGAVMQLCKEYRSTFVTMDNRHQVTLEYEMPLSEMIDGFFDNLKSVTSGFASFDWQYLRHDQTDADKLTILLNGNEVSEFSEIVVQERSREKAESITKKLKELIPKQQYEVRIQAKYKGKIIASERNSALRKDVTAKLYGGDRTRKDKLLEKQKKGKKKMKAIGKIDVPKEAFFKLFNS